MGKTLTQDGMCDGRRKMRNKIDALFCVDDKGWNAG